eukprot:gene7792-10531_t
MGSVASINHAHHTDTDEKHEVVHGVISKLPQYQLAGDENFQRTVVNGNISMKKLREIDPYLKYGGSYSGDIKDTVDFKYLNYEEFPTFGPGHNSVLSKILTPELFEKLKDKKTKGAYTLSNAILAGVVTPDLQVGATAGDEESWEVFQELFYPIVKVLHRYDPTIEKHTSDFSFQKIEFSESQSQLFDKFVVSTRIRAVRNISGFSLPPGTTDAERIAVESILRDTFSGLSGDLAGTYFELANLTKEQTAFLNSKGFLFAVPTAR